MHAYTDRSRLQQLLSCFAWNALKFSVEKPIHIQISVNFKHLVVLIIDEGCGMSPQTLSLISRNEYV